MNHASDREQQLGISETAGRTAQPEPGRYTEGHRHPDDDLLLELDVNLIGLHLDQIHRMADDQVVVSGLAMPTGSIVPVSDRALVEVVCMHDGLYRAAKCKQGDDEEHGLI